MAMRRCKQGHYYEAERYSTCPACGVDGLDIGPTKPKSSNVAAEVAPLPETQSKGQSVPADNVEEIRTVGVVKKQSGIDPVVGWLVCIEGADRGRDYRIRSERNLIGRAPSMDICISGDDTISRTAHAVISFEPRRQTFRLLPGEGHGLVYLDDEVVEGPTELKPYAKIELGQTKLLFVPLCGERFSWTERKGA
jgi:hypothetical protein